MKIDKRWLALMVALSAAAGAVVSKLLRRRQLSAQRHDEVADLKAWENEGGNLEPHPAPSVMPSRTAGL